MDDEKEKDKPQIQAEDNSIAIGGIQIDGDLSGTITIGHGYTAEQVSVLLKEITTTFQPKPFDGRCPYKGLDVFEEEDAELFFGREMLVEDLVSRVKESRTVFITGPSGSGKSSLVRAGLIHALKQGGIKNLHSERWLYETMKPGREPIKDLALAFSRLKSPELSNYFLAHKNAINILNECAESVLSGRKDQRFVLFIDQFEEVFTQVNQEEERLAFLNMLAHAATIEDCRVIVLFAMRSDFVSNCATYPMLNELLSQEFRQVGAMQSEELVSAIALPARHVGLSIEDELIARIINDMKGEPGALPLMQFALKDLFDSQQAKGGVIAFTLADYLKHGGIHKSLERHADNSFAKLSESEQELARSIFSGLIEIGRSTADTKRTALFNELVPANTQVEDVRTVLQKLADARLITTEEEDSNKYTLTHEKLISAWPWLKKLVNENRDVIALQNEIANDAKEWEDHQRDKSYLYSGARLATAQEKIKNLIFSESAQAFLKDSIKAEDDARRQSELRQRRIFTGLISFSVTVLGLLIFALIQLNISRAQQFGYQAQASFLAGDYYNAGLYALQSNKIHKTEAANSVLNELLYKNFMLGEPLDRHIDLVSSLAWSTDGRLAAGKYDGTVIIWELNTGEPPQTLEVPGWDFWGVSLAWSTDGRLAAGGGGTVMIWDLTAGKPPLTLKGPSQSLAWSADGRLASGGSGTVVIWDLTTGEPSQTRKGPSSIDSLAWFTDGRLASGTKDGTVMIWDLNTRESDETKTLKGQGSIESVALSTDGRLAAGTWDGTVVIWDLTTQEPPQTLVAHTDAVMSVAWSTDGRLAAGTYDGTVIIWELNAGEPPQILKGHAVKGYADLIIDVAWSADGRLASVSEDDTSSGDSTVIIWDSRNPPQTLQGYAGSTSSLAWSADGQLASGGGGGTVIVWDLTTGKPSQTRQGSSSINSLAWSTDGRLASGGGSTMTIWDLTTGKRDQTLEAPESIESVAWSADGRLAAGTYDGTVVIWDLNTQEPPQTLKGHTSQAQSVAWSSKGQLASAGYGMVIVWDLTTGQPAQTLRGHKDWVLDVAWSTDGQLASASEDGTVIIWDLTTEKPARTLNGHTLEYSVAWSADGRLAAGGGDTVIIWDSTTGEPIQTLQGYAGLVDSLAWSSNGQLAFGSSDGTIRIPRSDLTGVSPCAWILRNMSVKEWIDTQGRWYPYEATCPNLPRPELRWWLTWIGRLIYFTVVLINIAVIWTINGGLKIPGTLGSILIVISFFAHILFLQLSFP